MLNFARMPEKLVQEFRKKISLKEFEVTNTSSSGGSYSKGFQIKEAEKSLQVNIILTPAPSVATTSSSSSELSPD